MRRESCHVPTLHRKRLQGNREKKTSGDSGLPLGWRIGRSLTRFASHNCSSWHTVWLCAHPDTQFDWVLTAGDKGSAVRKQTIIGSIIFQVIYVILTPHLPISVQSLRKDLTNSSLDNLPIRHRYRSMVLMDISTEPLNEELVVGSMILSNSR